MAYTEQQTRWLDLKTKHITIIRGGKAGIAVVVVVYVGRVYLP